MPRDRLERSGGRGTNLRRRWGRRRGLVVVVFRPGAAPLRRAARVLAGRDGRLWCVRKFMGQASQREARFRFRGCGHESGWLPETSARRGIRRSGRSVIQLLGLVETSINATSMPGEGIGRGRGATTRSQRRTGRLVELTWAEDGMASRAARTGAANGRRRCRHEDGAGKFVHKQVSCEVKRATGRWHER